MVKTLVAGVLLCALGFFFVNQWIDEKALETQAAEDYGLTGIAMDLHRECLTTLSGQRLRSDIVYKEGATRQRHCACIAARSADRMSEDRTAVLSARIETKARSRPGVGRGGRGPPCDDAAEEYQARSGRRVFGSTRPSRYCRKELVVAR